MTCAGHGLSGKDSVRILDGTFNLTTTKDGIHASNDDDETLGYIYIAGGDFTICSQDDGMHADSALYIEDGTIDITESYEGLEGQTITILDGTISTFHPMTASMLPVVPPPPPTVNHSNRMAIGIPIPLRRSGNSRLAGNRLI